MVLMTDYRLMQVKSIAECSLWGGKSGMRFLFRAAEPAWDVLFGVANLCGMFCPGCQKIAWDVLSWDVLFWDVLSYIHILDKRAHFKISREYLSLC